jgi:tripartite-type tricarboxylate transporter receptor subunit TctC
LKQRLSKIQQEIIVTTKQGAGLLRIAALASAFAALAAASGEALSQNYPSRPVRLIVPFTPGGGTDLNARTLAPRLAEGLGQQVVVDNRPGAGGALGAELAGKAPPDGYTIWIGQTANLAIGPALRKQSLYDPIRDFAPITMIQKSPSAIVVSAGSPLKSIKDLIAAAKKNPQGITYGSAGVGTAGHINGYLINVAAGIDMTHVPYKGASPAMLDLQAGRITLMATSIGSSAGMIKQGKIRAIGTTGAKRARLLPDVPTLAEQGLKGFDVSTWLAMLAPAKTPSPIVTRLNNELVRILALPDVQEKLMSEGGEVTPTSPEEAAAFIRSEVAKWGKALKGANIPVE